MGAKGGSKKVTAWRCTTCTRLHERKQNAVECCDQRVWERQNEESKKRTKKALSRVKVRYEKDRAYAYCPLCKGRTHGQSVTLRMEREWGFAKISKKEAKKKAVALLKAQLSRHISTYHER